MVRIADAEERLTRGKWGQGARRKRLDRCILSHENRCAESFSILVEFPQEPQSCQRMPGIQKPCINAI